MTSEQGENAKFRVNTIISFAYIKYSRVSLLKRQQNNLSNPELYSEPCQTCKKVFCQNKQRLEAVNFFRKPLHIRCLTEF